MRKVFLDELPHKGKQINWKDSIGHKVHFIYDDIEEFLPILDFIQVKDRSFILTKFKDQEKTYLWTGNITSNKFGSLIGKYELKYIYNVGDTVDNLKSGKLQILEQIRISSGKTQRKLKAYKYKCLICGDENEKTEDELKRNGCGVCAGQKTLKGYNDLWTTHPHLAKMLKFKEIGYEFSLRSNKKAIFICEDCKHEKIYSINNITSYGFSCPKCGDGISFPNKIGFNFLEQLKIDFIFEYSPDWLKPKRYDFYFELNNKRYVLEMDGKLGHGNENKWASGIKSQATDDYKDKLAKEHSVKIIRIDCRISDIEYIKNNIFNSELSNLFNLSIIDWEQCNKYATSNLAKVACQTWNDGCKNTMEIGKLMKLHRSTIARYLKQGTKMGWCDYDAKVTTSKRCNSLGEFSSKYLSKKVICLNTKIIYNSLTEASKEFNITPCAIGNCCKYKTKTVAKVRWQYYSEYIKSNPLPTAI